LEHKDTNLRPRISIKGPGGKTLKIPGSNMEARYHLPVEAMITVVEGQEVKAGDIIAKFPREISKQHDITGGLPRVAELFEARKPKKYAIISEIDGFVSFGKDSKGKRKVIITPEVGEPREYIIPKGKYIIVREGEFIKAGEKLIEGSPNPHDILRVLGIEALAKFLVDEIQNVYRLQGVKINDKHCEIIVRQMLRKVKIKNPGDTPFLEGDIVDKFVFKEENLKVVEKGGKPATAEPVFYGITKASLSTDSFISAASFQETTKVLTQAAVEGKIDFLRGLKENVIVGRLIPAGTGLTRYRNIEFEIEGSDQNNILKTA
jgi:DNA-directed RNA polymerase subunit beta'